MDRTLYRQIKAMAKDTLTQTLNNIYDAGKDDALKEISVTNIDYEKIRSEISAIKGIGETRLEQIMTVIKNNIEIENQQ